MNESIEDRLDAALGSVPGNSPSEPLVAPSPELAELLQVVSVVRIGLKPAQPSAAGIKRGRARLLAELWAHSPLPPATNKLRLPWRWNTQILKPRPVVRRTCAALALLVALFACNGVLAVSAGSLPGDPLYELKLLQEQLRLSLAAGPLEREVVRDQIDESRAKELKAVRGQHRVIRTEISGAVESFDGTTLIVGELQLHVRDNTALSAEHIERGDRVVVVVQTNADGSVEVIDVRFDVAELMAPAPAVPLTDIATRSLQPTPERPTPTALPTLPHPSPVREQQPAYTATWAPTSEPPAQTPASSPTRASEATRAPTANRTPLPSDSREPSRTPRAYLTPRPFETPRATETRKSSETPRPTESEEPTETRLPAQTRQPTATRVPSDKPRQSKTPDASPTPLSSTPTPPDETSRYGESP
jgi:hypothetical protein